MIATVAAEIVIAIATVASAIATYDEMVRAIRSAATRAPAVMRLGRNRLGRINPLGQISRRAKISRPGKMHRLDPIPARGPISLARSSLAAKASARRMIAASAASEEDEAVDGVDVAGDATAVKTTRMAPVPTQAQVRTQVPPAAQSPARGTRAANARQPRLLWNPRRRHVIRRRSEIRLQRRRRLRYAAPIHPLPTPDRTINTWCGPQPRAMFNALDPRTGSAASVALIAGRRRRTATRPQGRVGWRWQHRRRDRPWYAAAVLTGPNRKKSG